MEPAPVTIILGQKQNIKKLRKMLLSKPCASQRVKTSDQNKQGAVF